MRQRYLTKPVYPNEITVNEITELRARMKDSLDQCFGLEDYVIVCNTLQSHNGGLGFVVIPDCFNNNSIYMNKLTDKGYAIFKTMSFTFYKRGLVWKCICHTGGDYKKGIRTKQTQHNSYIIYNKKELKCSVKGDSIAVLFGEDMQNFLFNTKQAVTQSISSNVLSRD